MTINRKFVFLVLLIDGCTSPEKTWDEKNTRELDEGDPRVRIAATLAQKSLEEELIVSFHENSSDSTWGFFVKCAVAQGGHTEHMWFRVLSIEDEIAAILDNIPQTINSIKYRDTVKIENEDVEDFWVTHNDTIKFGDFINQRLE